MSRRVTWVVPAALEVTARKVVAQTTPALPGSVSPLDVLVDPRLDAHSASQWYVAADPTVIGGLEYALLEDQPGPVIELAAKPSSLGLQMKVRLDFGCTVTDHRSLFRNG